MCPWVTIGELVMVEPQQRQVGKAVLLRQYLPAPLVGAEEQPFEVEEAAQLWRNLAR